MLFQATTKGRIALAFVASLLFGGHSSGADAAQTLAYIGLATGASVISTGPNLSDNSNHKHPHETMDVGRRVVGGLRFCIGPAQIGGELETVDLGVQDEPDLPDIYNGKRRLRISGGNASVIMLSEMGMITPFVKIGSAMLRKELVALDNNQPPRLLTRDWSLRPSLGIGIDVEINNKLSLRVENQIFWTQIDLPGGGSAAPEPVRLLTAGLFYRF